MAWSIDARIPVRLGSLETLAEGDALIMEGEALPAGYPAEGFTPPVEGHVAGCACCVARGSAAVALDRLFQRRARGEVGFFRRVVAVTATSDGDMAVWSALRTDQVILARFRLED